MIDTTNMPFRKAADLLGCPNTAELCDMDVWKFIMKAQGKTA